VISFRYHVFTIVAIFLAVALGIAVGNAYVQPALVDQLQRQTEGLSGRLATYRSDNDDLRAQVSRLQTAGDILPVVDPRTMVGAPVIVVTQDGTDADVLDQATRALDETQADLVAVLSVTDKVLPSDAATRPELAQIVGVPSDTPADEVAARLADALAGRLVTGTSRRGAQPDRADLLDELLRGQYLRFARGFPSVPEAGLTDVGGRGEIVIVLSGSKDGLSLAPDSFAVPLVEGLVARGADVAAGEPASTADPFVDVLRGKGELDASTLVTVDDLDWTIGGAALVLGLERAASLGQGGDYGYRGNADGPIPPIP
jgi:hypothetical protein